MTLGNRLADLVLIVDAIGGEGSDGVGDLIEQSVSHRGIVGILSGHRDGDDLAAVGIDADMQLRQDRRRDVPCFSTSNSPAPPSIRPVLSTSKCSGPVPSRRSRGTSNVLARRLRRRVVRQGEVEPEQSDDRADQTFGLPQGEAKHQAYRQGRTDRPGGVMPLAAWRGPRLCLPRLDRLVR
jgi:hypothetical protein